MRKGSSFLKEFMLTESNKFRVTSEHDGQRIDNFLIRLCKKIPKSRLYKAIRVGEVRIGSSRINATYRLFEGDIVRIPPLFPINHQTVNSNNIPGKEFPIIYEDEFLLVINKPNGKAVHGGSGISLGIIEQLRTTRPDARFLELVHRIDRDTSGLLMIAKKRRLLCQLHDMLRNRKIKKLYLALVNGFWAHGKKHINLSLSKKINVSGERMVYVDPKHGKKAETVVRLKNQFKRKLSLLEIEPKTGRTHQIRVHLASIGFPVLGDEKYGTFRKKDFILKRKKFSRMYLHAHRLVFTHPILGKKLDLVSEFPKEYEELINEIG